jgi:ADP-heptose:LPS heptosyltransferase
MPVASILVYVTSDADNALGENVLKLPLLLALAAGFPQAKISWVPGTTGDFHLRYDLAPLVDGHIAEFITDLDIPTDPRAALRTRHPILERHFDLIIDTQRYLGRTLFLRRIPHGRFISGTWRYFFSQVPPPRGLSRRPPRLTDKLLGLAAAAAGCALPVPIPIPLPSALRARAAELLPAGASYIGFAPGAGVKHTGKCWPLDGFISLAQQQAARGHVPVFFLGPAERDWCQQLREAVPEALFPEQQIDPAAPPETRGPSLVAALAERLSAALANCSGTGHLLAAGGAPMVSLYGPTRPEKYAPFARALICIKAQDFGSDRIADIPLSAVAAALEQQIPIGPAAAETAPANPAAATSLSAPISAGELLDKITILEIKAKHVTDPLRHRNVMHELAALRAVRGRNIASSPALETLCHELGELNLRLWNIEDELRQRERERRFDEGFIELARSVYRTNDRRAMVKRQLNQLTGSMIIEEKSYLDG